MKNLLFAAILLFSTIAFAATETTVSLTGLTLEKGQVVTVELRSDEHIYIEMFRVPTDTSSEDELNIVLRDAIPGTYDMTITVNAGDVRKHAKGEYAMGKRTQMQYTQVTID